MSPIFFAATLFFPRLFLAIFYCAGFMPANDTPLVMDIVLALIAPRILLAWWAYGLGAHPLMVGSYLFLWFWVTVLSRRSVSASFSGD
jgi:hypothetical protein